MSERLKWPKIVGEMSLATVLGPLRGVNEAQINPKWGDSGRRGRNSGLSMRLRYSEGWEAPELGGSHVQKCPQPHRLGSARSGSIWIQDLGAKCDRTWPQLARNGAEKNGETPMLGSLVAPKGSIAGPDHYKVCQTGSQATYTELGAVCGHVWPGFPTLS